MFHPKIWFLSSHLFIATSCHGFLHRNKPTKLPHQGPPSTASNLKVSIPFEDTDDTTTSTTFFDIDDLECDAEYTESSTMTSTLSQGTEESDIILSWEPDVADRIREMVVAATTTKRSSYDDDVGKPLLVGVVGNPGSGKTTSCFSLKEILSDIGCFVMPFDGYHIPMADLEASSNAEDLIYRRGAPDTFNPDQLLNDIQRIKTSTDEKVITLPGFDHEKGDPEPDEHEFRRDEHNIVLVEGLYLLHDDAAWRDIAQQFDYSIFVNANVDVCIERLKIRNQCIPGYTKEEIEIRCEAVDRANAMIVERSKARASLCVDSAAQRTITTTISDGTPESDIQRTWENDVAEEIREELSFRELSGSTGEPYMLAIAGGPGSGKTTSCQVLSELLDDVGCMVVPFDGYHKPISSLQKDPNAADLLYRRGSPDTFDTQRLKADLTRIRNGDEACVSIPGFNHAIGDPENDVYKVERGKHKVVLCEGLYLLHDDEEWKGMKNLFDYSVFMDADVDNCIERLKVRNKCVPGASEEEIELRCENVDRVNANIIDNSKSRADLVVESVVNVDTDPSQEKQKHDDEEKESTGHTDNVLPFWKI